MLDKLKEIGDNFYSCLTIVDMEDPEHPCIYANNKFFDNTGYNIEEVTGKNLSFLQGEDTDQETILFMKTCFKNSEPCCQDIVNYKKDNTPFINRLVMLPLEYEGHRYYFGFQNNITTRLTEDKEILNSYEVPNGLIQHVINNKLTVILGKLALNLFQNKEMTKELHHKLAISFKDINDFCLNIEDYHDFHF